ncbi:MAG TPA: DUF4038 domain-containing protein [Thermoanaerobaculia bacterium]|nr:DUF4038 domain-containing protein [Thermoanaerobaculia bacterium]
MWGRRPTNRRPGLLPALLLILGVIPPAAAQDQVREWRRWETVLTSARDYTANDGNPYRDLVVEVTFQRDSPFLQVSGVGFWDGGRTFKVRAALPAGTWRWTTSCVGATGGQSCGGPDGSDRDQGLWRTGSVRVLPGAGGADVPEIYRRGFLRAGGRTLLHGDGTPFYWLGDTAWQAPVSATREQWATYLKDRAAKGFTVVQIAPATQYEGEITSFEQIGDCPSPAIPNRCSRWVPEFWRHVDALVEEANRAGIVVAVAGLINPVGRGGTRKADLYPAPEDAAVFARNLAARLAGNFVIFSPGFDDRIDIQISPEVTTRDSMEAVGRELEEVAPRHLVANHLAGASPVSDYAVFQDQSWLSFQLFQSGHALNQSACGRGETRQQCAAQRARELPLGLWRLSPVRPAANGEGGYEDPLNPEAAPPDNRFGVRQIAYSSLLSGAFGFTLGVKGIYFWDKPMEALDSSGSLDMQRLGGFFRAWPWAELVPAPERILGNDAQPQQRRMALAGTPDESLAVAYLPNNDSIAVATGTAGLGCGPDWSRLWLDPRTGESQPVDGCTEAPGRITLTRPACQDPNPDVTGGCDWLLELRDTGARLSANSMTGEKAAGANAMQVWAAPAATEPGKRSSSIRARVFGPDGKVVQDGIVVSPAGEALQTLPVVARDARGGFFVAWQTGSGIFARRFDSRGRPLDRAFRVDRSRRAGGAPVVTADARGRVVVVWVSRGDVFAQRFGANGGRMGAPFRVNVHNAGEQSAPRVMADAAGNFVVAWRSDGQDGDGRGVFARLFDRRGRPRTAEIQVNRAAAGDQELTGLTVTQQGRFAVRWATRPFAGGTGGRRVPLEQWFDRDGRRLGEARTPVQSNP